MSTPMTLVDRNYQLLDQLGEGGMGAVFRALHLVNQQLVALKLVAAQADGELLAPLESNSEMEFELRMALAREFQTLASLHHPNIIRVQSYGFDDRRGSYFTMELLDEASSILEVPAVNEVQDKVLLVAQVLRALCYIHRRGVIHRDIKPGNILVVRGEVKLLDFGIAATQAEASGLAGTLQYMAPELLMGARPSVQSDLYAVGYIMHQLLAGCLPTTSDELDESFPALPSTNGELFLATANMRSAPLTGSASADPYFALPFSMTRALDRVDFGADLGKPGSEELVLALTGPLAEVVAKLLRHRPEERYQDAEAVLRDLSTALNIDIPVETAETRESFLRATILVGRDDELALLSGRLQDSKHGHGAAALIGGESGVGKSRLLSELRTLALVRGFWVAEGQSVTEGGAYYQEWLPLLRSLCLRVELLDSEAAVLKPMVSNIAQLLFRPVPDPPAVKPEEVQGRLLATLRGILARLGKPVLIILEDLHWGRSESIALLKELSHNLEQLPVMVVGTYRTDESPELPARLPGMTALVLSRLSQAQMAQLSESMLGEVGRQPGLLSYLERQTEGNVFFLIEIVRALAENAGELRRIGEGELPESVLTEGIGRIVERRVERVPESFRPLLQFAATFGRQLDLAVLAHAFPTAPLRSLLIQCANLAVLETQGTDWRFAHDKLREAILRQIPAAQRGTMHCHVAESLESVYSGEQRKKLSSFLAYHFAQAGLADRALTYYLQAADDATTLCLYTEARAGLSGAMTALGQLADTPDRRRLRVDLLLRQVQTSLLTDQLDIQIERTGAAQQLIQTLAGPEGLGREDRLRNARLHYYLGRAYHYAGKPAEAIKRYQLVLPVAQEFGDQELLVLPAYVTGIALCMQGNSAKGRELLGKAVGPMERLGNTFEWLRGVLFYGLTLASTGKYLAGIEQMNIAFAHAQRIGQPSVLAMCHTIFTSVYRTGGDWQRAATEAILTVENAKKSGDKVYLFAGWSNLSWVQGYLGQHESGEEHRRSALAVARQMGGQMIISDWFEAADGERAILASQPELALTRAQAVSEKSKAAGLVLSHGVAERVWACATARMGGSEAAFDEHFAESIRVLQRGENVLDIAHTEQWWGRIYLERGKPERARPHLLAAQEQYQYSRLDVALAALEKILAGL